MNDEQQLNSDAYVLPYERADGTSVTRGGELAVSFGKNVEAYDQYRPRYAPEAIDFITSRGHRLVLDVGCGTGILGAQLLAHGCTLFGVEPDERMARAAISKGLEVEVASFEDWEPAGRKFDAVVSGQAWHWIDPVQGQIRLAEVLKPHGEVFLLWNIGSMNSSVAQALDAVYRDHQQEHLDAFSVVLGRGETARFDEFQELLRTDSAFGNISRDTWVWHREYSTDEWLSHLVTHPQHAALDASDREPLFADMRKALEYNHAGRVKMEYTTLVISARAIA